MNKDYKKLIIALVVLFAILGGFIFYLSWPLLVGTTIILDTMPVDPFDPIRGQYMDINYEISNIPAIEGAELGDNVYVLLEPDLEGIWRAKSSVIDKPEKGVFIRGTVRNILGSTMDIKYGIEQFFFEKDAKLPTEDVTVKAKVDSTGRASIIELLQNGEPVNIEYEPKTITS